AGWVASTIRGAIAGAASGRSLALAESLLREMSMTMMRTGAVAALAAGLSLAAIGSLALRVSAVPPARPEASPPRVAEGPGAPSSKDLGPLDALERSATRAEDRFAWQPAELVAVLGEHRGRAWNMVSALAVSPDGKIVAAGEWSSAGAIRLWDAATL